MRGVRCALFALPRSPGKETMMADTMHLCDVDKLALATWEWVHADTCCDIVMCGHHAAQHRAQLEAQGFLCVKAAKVNA